MRKLLLLSSVLVLLRPLAYGDPTPAPQPNQQKINLQLEKGAPSLGVKIGHLSCYKDKISNLFLVSFKTNKAIQTTVKVYAIPRKDSKRPPILLAVASETKGKINPDTDHSLVLEEVGPEPLAIKKEYLLSIVREGGGQ